MFSYKSVVIFTCALFAVSESKFVDTLTKCSINDFACQAALVTSSLKAIQKTGIPELEIPPIDPMEFKDISISILDLVKLDAIEGVAKGATNCVVDKFLTEIKKGHSQMLMTCNNFSIKSKYVLSGSSPLVKNILGGENVHGEGNGKVKIEKIKLRFEYYYDMDVNKDGDVYFDCKFNSTIYDYEFLGKVTFVADDIHLGDQDATQLVLGFMNENSKFIMGTFGKIFLDKAMEYVYMYTHRFFDVVPAKYFIIEDLSEYVKH